MSNTYFYLPAAAALLAISLLSCGKGKKDDTARAIPEIEVATPIVDSVTLHKVIPGTISSSSTVDVTARVNGKIISQNYTNGQFVNKGQVLFTIESTTYRNAVSEAQAALEKANSQYAYYSKQYEAMKKALEADAVSQMDVSSSENSMKSALAAINTAKAQLQDAQTKLSYCTVTAPVAGHISEGALSPGNVVSGEGSPVRLATIYADATVKANFNLAETQFEEIFGKEGTNNRLFRNIPLKFAQDLSQQYRADLIYVAPSVDSSTGTVKLSGVLENPKNELKDGMYVTVELPYDFVPNAILVNDASIGTDQLGKYMYVVNDSNKVVYTPVETGEIYRDTLRMITKGLTEKSRYVTKAMLNVRNGEQVKPVMRKESK